jgi:GPH family glycoside/pentoside/hexuronide:cation symporter
MADGRLTLRTKLGFGVCDLGGNLFFTVGAFVILKYLTDTVGLEPWLAGVALSVGRILDAFSDPIVGSLSDRTRSRFGRRRPYMFVGSLVLFAAMSLFFVNPRFGSQAALFIWAAVGYTVLAAVGFTMINIPYSALTPEIASGYNERTSLNAYRFSFAILGSLLGAGLALPLVSSISGAKVVDNRWVGDPSGGYTVMGIIFGAVIAVTALITVFTVKETQRPLERPKNGLGNIARGYLSTFKNRAFVLILVTWTLNITGVTILSTVLQYYFTNVRNESDPLTVTLALLILLVVAMAFIPIWTLVSKRIGKKWSFMIGMLELAAAVLAIFFAGASVPLLVLYILIGLCGIGFSTGYALPWSILPDAIDSDYAKSGENREGLFYGIWTFSSKVGQALSALLIGWLLSATHYDGKIAVQGADTQLVIRLLFGPIGAAFYVAAVLVLFFYPITRAKHDEIRKQIEKMEAARPR